MTGVGSNKENYLSQIGKEQKEFMNNLSWLYQFCQFFLHGDINVVYYIYINNFHRLLNYKV